MSVQTRSIQEHGQTLATLLAEGSGPMTPAEVLERDSLGVHAVRWLNEARAIAGVRL